MRRDEGGVGMGVAGQGNDGQRWMLARQMGCARYTALFCKRLD